MAYYPGLRHSAASFGTDLPPSARRSDGHLGRFDYMVSPQHHNVDRPWLGFIRRSSPDSLVENAPFLSVWDPVESNRGRLKSKYLAAIRERMKVLLSTSDGYSALHELHAKFWNNRPNVFRDARLRKLESEMTLDDAIDELAALQRDLKELSVWNRMAECLWIETLPTFTPPSGAVPLANDSLMGVWINGCGETEVNWLLRNRVPCFIVHRGEGSEDIAGIKSRYRGYPSMIDNTAIANLSHPHNKMEKIMVLEGQKLLECNSDIGIAPSSEIPGSMRADRRMSSPVIQGWKGGKYVNPRTQPPSDSTEHQPTSTGKEITPPPVADSPNTGKWSHWIMNLDDKEDGCLIKRSRGPSDHPEDWIFYDRDLRRCIYLDNDLEVPNGYKAPSEIFGLPFPEWTFLEKINNQYYEKRAYTKWVYETEKPSRTDVGRKFQSPSNNRSTNAANVSDEENWVSLGEEDDEMTDQNVVNVAIGIAAADGIEIDVNQRRIVSPFIIGNGSSSRNSAVFPQERSSSAGGGTSPTERLPTHPFGSSSTSARDADRRGGQPQSAFRLEDASSFTRGLRQTDRYFQRNIDLARNRGDRRGDYYRPRLNKQRRGDYYRPDPPPYKRVASRSRSRSPKRRQGSPAAPYRSSQFAHESRAVVPTCMS